MKKAKVLMAEYIAFSPELGKVFGVCGALLIQQIYYWKTAEKHYHDGFFWVYNTATEWVEQLKVFEERTIRSNIKKLRELGVLVVGNYNKRKYDQTLWYRIDYEKLFSLVPAEKANLQFLQAHPANFACSHPAKIAGPIPEKNQKITTENNTAATQPKPTEFPELEATTGGEEMLPKNGLKKGPTNVQATLEKLAVPATEKKQSKIMELYKLWAVTVPQHHEEVKFVGKFTRKQEAQLMMLAKAWPQCAQVLEHTLIRWVKFGKMVVGQTEAKTYPSIPSVDFLVKHKDIAMNFYLAAHKVPEEKTLIKPGAINCTEEPKAVPAVQKVAGVKTLKFGGPKAGAKVVVVVEPQQSKMALKQQLLKEILKG